MRSIEFASLENSLPIDVSAISDEEQKRLLLIEEGHFVDVKSLQIAPAKLTKIISAFANADGGEVYVGIAEDKAANVKTWKGFLSPEAANGHIQIFEALFPLGDGFTYAFCVLQATVVWF